MRSDHRWVFNLCLGASLIIIAATLHFWGAAEVRADRGMVVILTLVGAMWLLLARAVFSLFGLSYEDDVKRRATLRRLWLSAARCWPWP